MMATAPTASFAIEHGVPLRPRSGGLGASAKYPFAEMTVGDSFVGPASLRKRASSAAAAHFRKYGRKFSIRNDGDGFRCWRVA